MEDLEEEQDFEQYEQKQSQKEQQRDDISDEEVEESGDEIDRDDEYCSEEGGYRSDPEVGTGKRTVNFAGDSPSKKLRG